MGKLNPLYGSKKTFDITYASPQETLVTAETLPTTEPTDPQFTYTIAASDLPTFSTKPFSVKYIACVYGAGKFVTAGTLSWRMMKNGASVATGTAAVAANTFYTANAFFLDVVAGDIVGLKLWSNQTDSNWDYKALFVYVTRLIPFPFLNYKQVIGSIRIYNISSLYPTLTLGNPTRYNPNYPYAIYDELNAQLTIGTTGDNSFHCLTPHLTYGVWRIYYHGDIGTTNSVNVQTDATYRPKYWCNNIKIITICRALRVG